MGASSNSELGSDQRKTARQRAKSRGGPSVRERLAAARVNIPAPSLQSLQGKLSSTLGHVTQQLTGDESSRITSPSNDEPAPRRSTRRSDAPRTQTLYKATSRAETQRKTDSEHQFQPRKNRRLYDARSEAVPPVMVRGGMDGMAFGRVASSKLHKQRIPKRRFDVPLSIPGAEVRLPSLPLINLGWRSVSLIMVFMMIACLFLIWKAPVFQVKAVEAEGLKRLTVGDLNTVMGSFGKSVFSLSPNVLKLNLQQAFPELEKISVRINLPANVKVWVVEREPVIAWTQDGTEAWVDAQGVSFPPRGNPEAPLVRVEGYGTPPGQDLTTSESELQNLPAAIPYMNTTTMPNLKLSTGLVSAILELGAKMPADTLLVYDSEHGLGWTDPNGWEVYFGSEDQDMEMKLKVYQALVEHLQSKGIQPALISVEYIHAPYYRMER